MRKAEMLNLQTAKRELALKKMKKESLLMDEELSGIGKRAEPVEVVKTRTVQRPLFDGEGQVRKDDQGRVIAERVTEPITESTSASDPLTMMTMVMQMMETKRAAEPIRDPEIAELKSMVHDLTIQQKDAAYKSEIERAHTEKDNLDREYRDNLKRMEDNARDKSDREHKEHMAQLEALKISFDEKLEQRDQLGKMAGAYEQKFDDMKEMMRSHQSSVKDTVVKQASSTADKMTSQVGDMFETAAAPLTEMMKQQYQTNLEIFRQQNGLKGDIIPKTSDNELAEYLNED